jgi:hypothetical protein
VREAIPFLLLACACGAATWSSHSSDGEKRSDADAARDASSEASGADPRYSTLEARAASVAPGMRRVAERENAGERVELVRAAGRDTCARVLFEAPVPIVAKLVDAEGRVLAETGTAATQGTLGEKGPVCIRKGESVNAVMEGTSVTRVRWVALSAP